MLVKPRNESDFRPQEPELVVTFVETHQELGVWSGPAAGGYSSSVGKFPPSCVDFRTILV